MSPLAVAHFANSLLYLLQGAAFAYLFVTKRGKPAGLWTCASVMLLCWSLAGLAGQVFDGFPASETAFLTLLLAAVTCLCDGTRRLMGSALSMSGWLLSVACAVWAGGAAALGADTLVASVPAGLWIPFLLLSVGVKLVRAPQGRTIGGRVAALAFIAWGLHFANYPLLRDVAWFAPLGFVIAGALDVVVLIGLLALHFETAHQRASLLEAQLATARKLEAIGRITGGIAHDFNNLLSVIVSGTQLVARSEPLSDRDKKILSNVLEASKRAAELTGQLLTFSRKRSSDATVIDATASVRGIEKLTRALLGDSIELTISVPDEVLAVRLDPAHFHQIILNLVVNARDAMPDGGTFTLRLRHADAAEVESLEERGSGRWIAIEVADTGTGMPQELADRAFEPFFTTKQSSSGTGLGLAIVHGTVAHAGGTIRMATREGLGTSFLILLPEADARQVVPQPEDEPATASGSVLLAEDEPLLRAVARDILEAAGYTVSDAPDGVRALRVFEDGHGHFDAVVTDIVMPGMNGYELALALRDRAGRLPIVLTSGYPERITAEPEPLEPPALFLPKPYTPDALVDAVRRAQRETASYALRRDRDDASTTASPAATDRG